MRVFAAIEQALRIYSLCTRFSGLEKNEVANLFCTYTTGQNCGTTYKNCIKNMLVFESGYLREKLS